MDGYESKTEERREAMHRAWTAYCAAKRAFEESERRDAEWFDAILSRPTPPESGG